MKNIKDYDTYINESLFSKKKVDILSDIKKMKDILSEIYSNTKDMSNSSSDKEKEANTVIYIKKSLSVLEGIKKLENKIIRLKEKKDFPNDKQKEFLSFMDEALKMINKSLPRKFKGKLNKSNTKKINELISIHDQLARKYEIKTIY